MRHAFERGDFGDARAGPILDAGCGAGDNANWLAARGHEVVGFDISEGALAEARRRSRDVFGAAIEDAGGSAEFVRASGLDLASSAVARAAARQPGGFAVVLDSALLHCLDDASQRTYVGELAKVARRAELDQTLTCSSSATSKSIRLIFGRIDRSRRDLEAQRKRFDYAHRLEDLSSAQVTRCGGRLYLGCFSDANPDPWSNPRRISEAQIRALFDAPAWRVLDVAPVWYERPRAHAGASGMGAFTMAHWAVVERKGAL